MSAILAIDVPQNVSVQLNYSALWTYGICVELILNSPYYIKPSISAFGLFFNSFCILVFFKMSKTTTKGNMAKYLIAKSIFDICFNLCSLFPLVNNFCDTCTYTYWFQLILLFQLYLRPISVFLSVAFHFVAIFDRYRLITNKFQLFNKILHWLPTRLNWHFINIQLLIHQLII